VIKRRHKMAEKVYLFNIKMGERVEVVRINVEEETITCVPVKGVYSFTAPYKDFLESVCIIKLKKE
jgi:hypothetical protein